MRQLLLFVACAGLLGLATTAHAADPVKTAKPVAAAKATPAARHPRLAALRGFVKTKLQAVGLRICCR